MPGIGDGFVVAVVGILWAAVAVVGFLWSLTRKPETRDNVREFRVPPAKRWPGGGWER